MNNKLKISMGLTIMLSTLCVNASFITGIEDSETGYLGHIEVGGFSIGWSRSNTSYGYLYNENSVAYANVVDSSVWSQSYDTYNGFSDVVDIGDATAQSFISPSIIAFADKGWPTYRGIFLARQNNEYLAIDPIDIYISNSGIYTLKYQYWYSDNGETDFSAIPEPNSVALLLVGSLIFYFQKTKRTQPPPSPSR